VHVEDPTGADPLYGYRPAMSLIADRIHHGLSGVRP
jgi:hypothetical protein